MDALGLVQLQRRIRDTAARKMRERDMQAAKVGFRQPSAAAVASGASARTARSRGSKTARSLMTPIAERGARAGAGAGAGVGAAVGGGITAGGLGGGVGQSMDRGDMGSRWGVRRNYQDLVEAQTKAAVLLHEHAFNRVHLDERQVWQIRLVNRAWLGTPHYNRSSWYGDDWLLLYPPFMCVS